MTMPSVAVFDIGEVLVEWHPHLAWDDVFPGREDAEAFMQRTGFFAFNMRGDAGERFAAMALELPEGRDRDLVAQFGERHRQTIRTAIDGTWALVDRLRGKGVPLHAITNWAAETWPGALDVHPRLAEVFGTIVVSGREGLVKPDPAIYRLLCERAGVRPEDCVFIDDKAENVEGAKTAGMDGIRFTGPEALEAALTERRLL